MKPSIYLAGPISGLTYGECTDWRHAVTMVLEPQIKCWSPMRAKNYLAAEKNLSAKGYDQHVLSSARGIMARDFFDATRSDMVFCNLLGATRVSIGTVMELAWAYQARVPVVCIMEPGNVHEHMMVEQAIDWRVPSFDVACEVVRAVLL